MDEKKHYGIVDESSSEQVSFINHSPSDSGFYNRPDEISYLYGSDHYRIFTEFNKGTVLL